MTITPTIRPLLPWSEHYSHDPNITPMIRPLLTWFDHYSHDPNITPMIRTLLPWFDHYSHDSTITHMIRPLLPWSDHYSHDSTITPMIRPLLTWFDHYSHDSTITPMIRPLLPWYDHCYLYLLLPWTIFITHHYAPPLHYATLHYTTLHYTNHTTLHYTCLTRRVKCRELRRWTRLSKRPQSVWRVYESQSKAPRVRRPVNVYSREKTYQMKSTNPSMPCLEGSLVILRGY